MRSHYLWVRVRLGSGDNAGHETDPFVRSKGVSTLVEGVDGEGEEMNPGPVFGLKRKWDVKSLGNVDESSDLVRAHRFRVKRTAAGG